MGRFLSIEREPAPSELFLEGQTSNTSSAIATLITDSTGCKVSPTITSSTLTEVINESSAGYITFGGLLTSGTTSVTNPKMTIVIDGIEVFSNLSMGIILDNSFRGVIGGFYINTINHKATATEVKIRFNTSLVVSVAGDGTNGVLFAYKYYLT